MLEKRIKKKLIDLGKSQKWLSEQIGVSPSHMRILLITDINSKTKRYLNDEQLKIVNKILFNSKSTLCKKK